MIAIEGPGASPFAMRAWQRLVIHALGLGLSLCLALIIAALPGHKAEASITINGTRVIYQEAQREQTLRLENQDSVPVLVQAWADRHAGGRPARDAESPFLVTPSVFRLDPGESQTLRILRIRDVERSDQESLYWLNIKEVPPLPQGTTNRLQLGILTRLKLFYRPTGLAGEPGDAIANLQWHLAPGPDLRLVCDNPSNYHVSLIGGAWRQFSDHDDLSLDMLAPHSEASWSLQTRPAPGSSLWYRAINDYGAVVVREAIPDTE